MPTLNWIGKEKIINHHLDVPYRVLDHQYGFTEKGKQKQETKSGNKIIHGDNLEALKSLLPEYEGKIKCIYIDPPYNTGNEGWVYNDNVSHPKLQKWLGETVGKENEDLTRHDKWLCMMYPRLKLLHRLLADDGVIFISIDDNELSNLKTILDEIFGKENFIEYFSWIKTSTAPSLANKSRKTAEYVVCYEKNKNAKKYYAEISEGNDAPLLNSGNAKRELIFPANSILFKIPDGTYKEGIYEKVTLKNNVEIIKGFSKQNVKLLGEFKWTQNTLDEEINNGTTFIIKSDKFSIRYLRASETYKAPTNLLKEKYYTPIIDKKSSDVETNEGAKKELLGIFGKHSFDYPKPVTLISFFLKLIEDKNVIILDSFAGSGTTAHAVLNLNKQDGGNRKFILVELEDYAETITAERVKRVIKGYSDKEGTGGSFDYYTVGEPLFDEHQNLNELIPEEKIKVYIWYSETRSTYIIQKGNPYFLGIHNDTGYYFFYDKKELTTLDFDSLAEYVNQKSERYVIYADNCLLPESFLRSKNIEFKKIPRNITRF